MHATCTYMYVKCRVYTHMFCSHPYTCIFSLSLSSFLLLPSTHTHTCTHSHHSSTASSMRTTTDPADFLRNPIRYKPSFNLTNSTLAQFTPNNSVIFLGTHKITFTDQVAEELNYTSDDSPVNVTEISGGVQFPFPELDVIEQLYRTPFHRMPIPSELSVYWNVANDSNIRLPPSNMFIPNDFTIINKSSNVPDVPTKLSNPDIKPASMWWLLDTDDFHEPRVNLMCQLNNTNANISAAWEGKILACNMSADSYLWCYFTTAKSRLFAKFWETILEPRLYDATLVGYSYSVKSYTHGLMLSFSGPSDRMLQLISGVVSGAGMYTVKPHILHNLCDLSKSSASHIKIK